MLDSIIHYSIKNKLVIGILTLALVGWGSWSLTQLPIDAVPDITNNQVQVITTSPSLAAQEVERLITFPVELNTANIPGLIESRSISRFGLSVVTLVFTDQTDIYWARQQVTERLKVASEQIPPGNGTPTLAPVTTGLGEIYQYVVCVEDKYKGKYSAMELRTIQDWVIRRQLLGTQGVADVSSFGGYLKQYEIAIDPDKIRSMNVSIAEIFAALEKNNENTGGAYIDKKPNAWYIRTDGLATDTNAIKNIVVKNTHNGTPVLIKNVATVRYGHATRYGAMTDNADGEVVGGIVLMLKGENSNKVIGNVKERIEQIQKNLPEGVVIETFLDRSKLVNHAIGTVSKNLIEGALIVIFVLVLMLGNFRAGLVVASVIPLAMLFAIAMMHLFGVSGNLMSLGAIDFGLIVDGAVIIVEAILHRTELRSSNDRESMDDLVYNASSQIRSSAAFGEIIILIVYLPILALSGIEGKMFTPMAQTVSFAILGAFILSLTYVPMMSALVLKFKQSHKATISDRLMNFFQRVYYPAITFVLKKKISVVLIAFLLFIGSIILFMQMGGEFIPTLEEGDFAVETRVMTGSSLSHTIETSTQASDILLKKFPEVKQVVGKIGTSEIPTDPMPVEACDLMIILKDKDEWTSAETREELADKMAEALEEIPGVTFGFQQPIQMRFNELMTGARQDVAVKLYGENLDTLAHYADIIGAMVSKTEGAKDLYVEEITGLPQMIVRFDREKIAQFGLNISEINRTIRAAFAGEVAGFVYEGEKQFDLVVRLNKENRQGLEDLQNLFITTPEGHQIPLSQVAEVKFEDGPNQIQRDDTHRRITVAFNTRGRDVESIVEELQQKTDKIKLPTGYYITYGGQFKNLMDARSRLVIAVPVALFMIFVLLFFTFHSIKQSVLIFTAIPLSAIGGILALWIRGMPFSISAGVGFIALFGVAVLNGIVLIAEFNRLKKEGLTSLTDIVMKGTQTRLRPVLMTAMVASLGFLPMALSNGSGAEVQKPLATVVIGGLVSATLLTLLVLPALYILSESRFMKPAKIVPTLLIVGLITLGFSAKAQNADTIQAISIDEAISMALENNMSLKSAQYQTDYQQQMRGSSTDIGKTSAILMYGQYNSYYNDNNLTITQSIPFPTSMHRQAQYYDAAVTNAELNQQIIVRNIKYQVKSTYYLLQYAKAKRLLLMRQDTIFSQFLKAAEIRLRTGETSLLEQSIAQSQLYEIRMMITQNDADIIIYQTQLQTLLHSDHSITTLPLPMENIYQLEKLTLSLNEEADLENNPALRYFKQRIELAERAAQLEKSKLMPDITVGYFNQSLYGTLDYNNPGVSASGSTRFQGVSVGLAFPIWAKPQLSRIKANEISQHIAEADYQWQQKNLEGQYDQAVQQYLKFKKSIEYYESTALPTAEVIGQNSWKNYQNGNIGYVEFSQGLNRALTIYNNYLLVLSEYNQTVLDIELLLGEE